MAAPATAASRTIRDNLFMFLAGMPARAASRPHLK